MEKQRWCRTALIVCVVGFFGLIAFASCVGAEFKRSKKKDLKLEGKLCYLPGSCVFRLGIAALLSLSIAQIIGNLVICSQFCCRERQGPGCSRGKPGIVGILLALSWVSFGVAAILMGTVASMSRMQPYGRGWVDGKCYLVKDGVCIVAAVLVLVTIFSVLGAATITERKSQSEQGKKVHDAQVASSHRQIQNN